MVKRTLVLGLIALTLAWGGYSVYQQLQSSPSITQAKASISGISSLYQDLDSAVAGGSIHAARPLTESNDQLVDTANSLINAGLMLNVSLFMLLIGSPLLLARYAVNRNLL